MIKLSTLTNYPDNPRTIGETEFRRLCESITRDPELLAHNQIVVDEAGVILCGNMRVRALRHLGYAEVVDDWIHVATGLTEEQKRKLVLLDNSPEGISGDWDWDMLANVYADLDLLTLGFEVPEIDGGADSDDGSEGMNNLDGNDTIKVSLTFMAPVWIDCRDAVVPVLERFAKKYNGTIKVDE